jgi:hypothetical protein
MPCSEDIHRLILKEASEARKSSYIPDGQKKLGREDAILNPAL